VPSRQPVQTHAASQFWSMYIRQISHSPQHSQIWLASLDIAWSSIFSILYGRKILAGFSRAKVAKLTKSLALIDSDYSPRPFVLSWTT
jgi:hypothetical protein